MKEQKDPMGGIIRFTYDAVGNKPSETDPRGNASGAAANSYTAWYYYDELYRVVKAVLPDETPPADPKNPGDNPVVSFDYDLNGNCVTETKANGQAVNYTYNSRNWLLTQSQTLDGKAYTTRFEYDGIGNKRFVYDNKGNGTEYRYDALSRLALQISPEGNTVSYDYDENGNRTAVRDGKHNETKYEYDALNRLKKATDADQKETNNWYNEEGRLTKTVSPTGLVTKFHVNELGMPLRVVDSLNQTRTFDYDIVGNTIYKKDPRGTESRFEYDDLYRVLRTDLQNGTRQQFLSYEYDPVGNIKQADNGQVRLVYNNADTSYDSDPFNRIKKITHVMPDGSRYNTEYRYDIMGQATGVRYPNSVDWLSYEYDKMGRVTAISGFAGTKNNPGFIYDENSALQTAKTDNGIITSYQRDKNGRITNIGATKSGNAILALHYEYDKANNIILRNDNVYVYDKLNRLQRATIYGAFEDKFTKADLLMGTADQDYHGSKEIEEDVTDQTTVKLDFAARSLILNLQTEADNVSKVELIPEVTGHRVPVEQIEIYYRNGFAFNKLERSKWVGTKDSNGKITIKFTPLLETGELKIHCNYDDLNYLQLPVDRSEFYNNPEKLVTVYQKFASRTESYEYDAMGNRTTERILLRKEYGWSYTYYPNSNRLKAKIKADGLEKFEYAYDANGNLISKVVTKGEKVDTWQYSFDLFNQLEQVKKNGEIVSSYVYDPNGFRVEKNGSKGKVHYVPLLNGEVGYKKEFSTNAEYSFVYVGIQHLARVNGVIGGSGKKFFYHNDHLGSALAVTDENGNKVVERDFTPFGERINTDVYDDEPRDIEEDESGFTGKDWDEDVGLYYYNARWYDSEIGRFISEDSEMDDPNGYGYCFNNPVNNIDPTGHFSVGMQSGLALFGTALNAVAILSKDEKLGAIASAFSLFVAVYSKHQAAKQAEIIMDDVENNEPTEDPVEQVKAETTPGGDASSINTGNQEATQPPPADEAPKSTEETIQELEPAAPVETPAPALETTPTAVTETKSVPKSSKEKIAAAYAEAKKLANATHEQLEVIAKNNQLTDAEFLYLCARYAYDVKKFDKKLIGREKNGDPIWETYCNQYAGYVYYLYTGSTQLINTHGKSLEQGLKVEGQIKVVTASKNGWSTVSNGRTAQNLANEGKFIIAFTSDHIAIIMPGQGVMGYGGKYYSPAIAQQGKSKILYGVTELGTLNYAWTQGAVKNVQYYGFNIDN